MKRSGRTAVVGILAGAVLLAAAALCAGPQTMTVEAMGAVRGAQDCSQTGCVRYPCWWRDGLGNFRCFYYNCESGSVSCINAMGGCGPSGDDDCQDSARRCSGT